MQSHQLNYIYTFTLLNSITDEGGQNDKLIVSI